MLMVAYAQFSSKVTFYAFDLPIRRFICNPSPSWLCLSHDFTYISHLFPGIVFVLRLPIKLPS